MAAVKVMVVDDERPLREALKDMLKNSGFTPLIAKDGDTALSVGEKEKPEVVLLDVIMPGLDGLDVLKKMHESDWGKKAKVLMLSNLSDIDEMQDCIKLGAIDYIIKSNFDIRKLKDKITEVLGSD